MFQLHKAPQFLLDLFRLRTTGGQPTRFGEEIVPVVDVSAMYGADMQLTSSTAPVTGALPLTRTFTVTNVARYWGAAAELTLGAAAGTTLRVGLFYRSSPGSVAFPVSYQILTGAPPLVANVGYLFGGLFPAPIVVPSGGTFFVSASGDAAGADHILDLRLFSEDPLR